jgi:hypothetical protein
MLVRRTAGLPGRILLIGLTAWALLMIAPDLYRVVDPLASAGFAADNDGRIYDVRGPFAQETDSPAWNAGLRVGDRLDLTAMRCLPPRGDVCATLLSVLGGMGGTQLVRPGRVLALTILPAQGGAAREVMVAAQRRPVSLLDRFVLLLNEIAGIAFVLAAAWLVWTRPGAMSWGFFVYAFWFNPGQTFVYFLMLQERPLLLLAQEVADSLAHGAACAGFLLFVLRVPGDKSERRWRNIVRGVPAAGVVLASMQLLSFANAFGYPTEMISRATFLADYAVDGLAVWILLRRQHGHPPQDFQRMRWVIWGCLIGLPAYILSGIVQSTSLWHAWWDQPSTPRDLGGLLLLIYGILGWFVFEAVRRPRVVNVSIPLRRITVFGLVLSVPALFAHQQIEHLEQMLELPNWAWIALASVLLFLISRLHELAVELADHVFNRSFRGHLAQLAALGDKILHAENIETIERLLTEGPRRQLGLASAAVFRRADSVLRRHAESPGWKATTADSLDLRDAALFGVVAGQPFQIDAADAERLNFPAGLAAPTLAVPVRDRLRCFAVALYGPHASGADLTIDERAMLGRLADDAALAYARVETEALSRQVAALELRLSEARLAS